MKRSIDKTLDQWKDEPGRLPLILRGARQVGKSFTIVSFGKRSFKSLAVVNFEIREEFKNSFKSLEPKKIIQDLEAQLGHLIIPGETLLFFDEIQECPRAITALRYFKEELPELHVIAAGSLLEFILHDEKFSFPVGRVQFLHMGPLSFLEFLEGNQLSLLKHRLENICLNSPPSEVVQSEFLKQVRLYLLMGGMPAVVQKYIETGSILLCTQLQSALLRTYKQDFGKYASQTQHRYLQRMFEKAPEFVGSHVRYSKIDQEAANPAREYKQAIRLLSNAGLIYPVYATAASGLPLYAQTNEKKFKLLFLDVGLLQRAMEIDPALFLAEGQALMHKGPIAEQFVGQELLAYQDPYEDPKLYFWEREQKGAEAEIDYLTTFSSHILPIEVKGGSSGRLRSLQQFMTEKRSSIGIKISEEALGFRNNILSIPFYLIDKLPQLAQEALKECSR